MCILVSVHVWQLLLKFVNGEFLAVFSVLNSGVRTTGAEAPPPAQGALPPTLVMTFTTPNNLQQVCKIYHLIGLASSSELGRSVSEYLMIQTIYCHCDVMTITLFHDNCSCFSNVKSYNKKYKYFVVNML